MGTSKSVRPAGRTPKKKRANARFSTLETDRELKKARLLQGDFGAVFIDSLQRPRGEFHCHETFFFRDVDAFRLQVGVLAAFRPIVSMRDVVSRQWLRARYFAFSCHEYPPLPFVFRLFQSFADEGKECHVSRPLDGFHNAALILRGEAGEAARKNLSLVVGETLEYFRFLVIQIDHVLAGERILPTLRHRQGTATLGFSERTSHAVTFSFFCNSLNPAYRLLYFSTRPAESIIFCLPVKNGWHAEQISTLSRWRVDRVVKVAPQLQTTSQL
jgi:hypothetical protein